MVVQGGFGVVIQIDVGTVLTALTKTIDVSYPEFEALLAESTGHDSTAGYTEWVHTGKRRMNEFTVTLAWDTGESTHAAVLTAFDADAAVSFTIADPDSNESIAFEGFVRMVGRISPQEDVYTAEVAIQPTGQATIT